MTLHKELRSIFSSGKFAHTWMISSDDISSSLNEVKIFASELLGIDRIHIENNPNFCVIERGENTSGNLAKYITVDQIRLIQSDLSTKNALGEYKVIVIYQAELMNINAANCCLKLLEETGGGNVIFLLTEKPYAIIPTIRSRCQKINTTLSVHNEASSTEDVMSYVEDGDLFMKAISEKLEKERVVFLYKSALQIVSQKIKSTTSNASKDEISFLLHQFDKLSKMLRDMESTDLDLRANFILLIEELSSCI